MPFLGRRLATYLAAAAVSGKAWGGCRLTAVSEKRSTGLFTAAIATVAAVQVRQSDPARRRANSSTATFNGDVLKLRPFPRLKTCCQTTKKLRSPTYERHKKRVGHGCPLCDLTEFDGLAGCGWTYSSTARNSNILFLIYPTARLCFLSPLYPSFLTLL